MARFFVIGVLSPVVFYFLFAAKQYLKVKFQRNPNFFQVPKYTFLVWRIHRVLVGLNPYYKELSSDGKRQFVSRLIVVLQQKQFRGRDGEIDTLEKRIIVLAALVQLTFGLQKFSIPSFNYVALYPSSFYSELIRKQVKGLTTRRGTLALSWLDTIKGIHDPSDNLHLALHEWSHALLLDHVDDHTNWMYIQLTKHVDKAEAYFEKLDKDEPKYEYLRSYAFTNEHEFFAVCVEHFFETPDTFVLKLPELFDIMCSLLNQNPLNTQADYALKEKK